MTPLPEVPAADDARRPEYLQSGHDAKAPDLESLDAAVFSEFERLGTQRGVE
ncbi:MAG: hypothetical protein L0H23_00680 [Luteimonas sp.]|nr:hypothetical protein [Luteimonas sp.]